MNDEIETDQETEEDRKAEAKRDAFYNGAKCTEWEGQP